MFLLIESQLLVCLWNHLDLPLHHGSKRVVWIASLEVKDFIEILVEQKGGWSRIVREQGRQVTWRLWDLLDLLGGCGDFCLVRIFSEEVYEIEAGFY